MSVLTIKQPPLSYDAGASNALVHDSLHVLPLFAT